ncbi:MAG: divalent-cation tolerance protein CutA [Balneolaceae bacterium]
MFKNLRFVYITTQDREEARRIGRSIIENRLATCINIIDDMESIYWWEGEIQEGKEAILIAKTPYHNINSLTRLVRELHSYDCPSIFTLTITEQEGNEEYLMWLLKEARKPATSVQPDDSDEED